MKTRVSYGCGLVGFRPVGISVGASGPAVPGPLTGLSAVFNDPDVDLTWNASSGADSYRIERAPIATGAFETIEAAEATTSYTDVAPDGVFMYRVTPVNTEGDGTAATSGWVATAAAAALQGLAVTFDADSGNLTWTASAYAASYKVERRDSDVGSGAGSYSTLTTMAHPITSYEDTTISGSTSAFDTAYDYRVTPQNSHTNGAAQESVYAKYIANANPTWPAFAGVEYKIWAAGGGGGGGTDDIIGGGGGGGGGYVGSTSFSFVGGSASVTIGAGGAAGIAGGDGGTGGESYCSELGVSSGSATGGFGGDSDGTGGVAGGPGGANGETPVTLVGGAGGAAGGSGGTGGAGGDEVGVPGEDGQIPGGGGGGGGGENPDNGGAGARGEVRLRYITPPTA